jgi:hypothetical protein
MERINVSQNKRFLITASGKPFFWLGDTAWEFFHRLNRNDAEDYLKNRQEKGFTVIQAVVLAEIDGVNSPNSNGDRPLIDNDPSKPNEAYFNYVDELIKLAGKYNLYIGLLPTWGDKVTHLWGAGPVVFTPENARIYGKFLGNRYKNYKNILWILGGDRPAITSDHDYRPVWREMALGIDEGTGIRTFKTYHPMGGNSSSAWLQDESWLDMHMMQSGHGGGHDVPTWEMISSDYQLSPTRPVLDGEPNYEDHPVSPWPKWDPQNGYFNDYDVRKQLYRSVFAGGCGVTYGHHSIWQFITPQREPITHPMIFDWKEALDRPGVNQLKYLRQLMESRPFLERIPDQSILAEDQGEGAEHIQATRDIEGSYAFIYTPTNKPLSINLKKLGGTELHSWWYDPTNGQSIEIGYDSVKQVKTFHPPKRNRDWVLVLDAMMQK